MLLSSLPSTRLYKYSPHIALVDESASEAQKSLDVKLWASYSFLRSLQGETLNEARENHDVSNLCS